MSKASQDILNDVNVATSHSLIEIQGDIPMDKAISEGRGILIYFKWYLLKDLIVIPEGTKVISIEVDGFSA